MKQAKESAAKDLDVSQGKRSIRVLYVQEIRQ